MNKTLLRIVIFFVAILCQSALNGQTAIRHVLDDRIDSLRKLITKAPSDTSKVELYLQQMNNYYDRYRLRALHAADSLAFFQTLEAGRLLSKKLHYAYGEGTCMLKEAKMQGMLRNLPARDERLQQAFSVFRTAHQDKGLAYAYIDKSAYHTASDKPTKIKLLDTAVQLARQSRDPKLEALSLRCRADLHYQVTEYATAIQELKTVLELQKRSGDNKMHYATDLLAQIYVFNNKHKEALECAIASIDHCRKVNDTVFIFSFYQRLGNVYSYLQNPKEAYYNYNRALSVMFYTNYNSHIAISLICNMSLSLKEQDKPREALDFLSNELKKYQSRNPYAQILIDRTYLDLYCSVKKFKEAEKYLLKVINPNKEIGIAFVDHMGIFTFGANVYYELKQYDKATRYADTAYAMAQQSGSRRNLAFNCNTLHKLELAKGNYEKALRYYKEYKNHSDSMQKEFADKRVIELAVKYETDQKNNQLQSLTKEATLHKEAIEQGKVLRNFMIAASILLLLLLLLIFNRYRVKHRANKLLQEKQDEINRQNQALEKMLVEKEWLMKEINHRVKNNLQVVMSLLNTQSAYLQDDSALNAIEESRHRVYAISLIHRKLYQSNQQLTTIDMTGYIKDVTEYLADSLNAQNRITFGLFIDPIQLDVTQAVPTGLIINEAVTNAVKYAFPEGRKGQINISMHKKVTGSIELTIQDNGIGLPADFDWRQAESLGMSLMQGLSTQLDGEFDVLQQDGLTIKITFQPAKVLNQ